MWAVEAGAWAGTVAVAAVAAGRGLRLDHHVPLLWATALTPYLYLPAYAAAAVAILAARPALLLASLALVAVHLALLAPEVGVAHRARPQTPRPARLKLLTANLYDRNPAVLKTAQALAAVDADVLVLQEVTPAAEDALRRAGAAASHPHALFDTRTGATGSAILSRLPLCDTDVWRADEQRVSRATVRLGDRRVRLCNVHPKAPTNRRAAALWHRHLRQLSGVAGAEARPLLLAGDYNATAFHSALAGLLVAAGLRDAHRECGRGLAPTWPTDRAYPPFMRLDRVLVSADVALHTVGGVDLPGTDHRAVLVELSI